MISPALPRGHIHTHLDQGGECDGPDGQCACDATDGLSAEGEWHCRALGQRPHPALSQIDLCPGRAVTWQCGLAVAARNAGGGDL